MGLERGLWTPGLVLLQLSVVQTPPPHRLSVFFFLPQEVYFLLRQKHIVLVIYNSLAGLGHIRGIGQEFPHLKLCVSGGVHEIRGGLIMLIPFQKLGKGPAVATRHPVLEELGPFPAPCTLSAAPCAARSP